MRNLKSLLVAALLAGVCAPVFAGNLYIVGSLGVSSFDEDKGDIDSSLRSLGATNISSSLDDNDTAVQLKLGYQFTPNFSVEAGYVDLGKTKYSATFTGGSAIGTVKAHGVVIAGVGTIPVNDKFSVFGKLGVIDGTVDVDVAMSGASHSASGTKWRPNYGVGAIYKISGNTEARVELEQFNKLGDESTTGTGNINALSAGIAYRF